MTPPQLNLSVLGPIVAVGMGAMFVLVGEVMLSRAKTFLGRKLTESYIGSVLALVSMISLGIATYMAADVARSGAAFCSRLPIGNERIPLPPIQTTSTFQNK